MKQDPKDWRMGQELGMNQNVEKERMDQEYLAFIY